MEPIFTIPYSEYEVITELQKNLPKSEGYSSYIPTSRQQKGIDFILHNNNKNKFLRFQVKSSRTYLHEPGTSKRGKIKFKYDFWLNNFLDKYQKGNSDYYLLFGLYPIYQQNKNIKSKITFWKSILLCFSEDEIFEILKSVKTKKEKKMDKFFGFGFNSSEKIFGTRGFETNTDFSQYLLKKKVEELKKKLQ